MDSHADGNKLSCPGNGSLTPVIYDRTSKGPPRRDASHQVESREQSRVGLRFYPPIVLDIPRTYYSKLASRIKPDTFEHQISASQHSAIIMSYPTRSLSSHIRQPSMAPPSSSTSQSPALIARVNEKKAELENLKELRDLSAAVASQMEALEQKLATLSDGTEGMCHDYVHLEQKQKGLQTEC